MTTECSTTLSDMNYDCLREIFKFLSPTEAFATIGILNDNVDDVARDRISQIKEFHVDMRFPPKYPDELFQLIGKSIKSLSFTIGYSIETIKVLNIMRPICTGAVAQNLTELSIQYTYFGQDYLDCILPIAPQIEVLSLCNCQLINEILKYILDCFVKLRRLDISYNFDVHDQAIDLARKQVPVVICEK